MNEIDPISDLLPLYVSGALDRDQRLAVEKHLPGCPDCQADLALWKSVSAEVTAVDQTVAAPRGMADKALAVALISLGRPSTLRVISRLKPPLRVTVTGMSSGLPGDSVKISLATFKSKSAGAGPARSR